MTDQSTTERIAELKKLAEAATPGPWEYRMLSKDIPAPRIDSASGKVVMKTWDVLYSNCEFIAAANPQAILSLIERIAELERKNAELVEALHAVSTLIDESQGVSGLHLNGDIAPWEELRTGGRFESWLADFDTALASHHKEDKAS